MRMDANDLEKFEEFVGVTTCKLELSNSKGETMIMELEPLESIYFGKIIYVQERMPRPKILNPKEHKTGRKAIYESEESMLKRLQTQDYEVWGTMMDLLKTWVKQSYPDVPNAALNKLLASHAAIFITEFMRLHNDIDEDTGKEKEIKDFVTLKREQLQEDGNTSQAKQESE